MTACYRCRKMFPKAELLRVARSDGKLMPCCATCAAKARPSGFPGRVIP